jgi:hypothetical protein
MMNGAGIDAVKVDVTSANREIIGTSNNSSIRLAGPSLLTARPYRLTRPVSVTGAAVPDWTRRRSVG